MRILQPAAGVSVGIARIADALGAREPDPSDAQAARDMPPWRAAEYLAARIVLRELLAATAPVAANEPLAIRATGQPYLPGRPSISVSLSHSEGHVAAAVGMRRAVGIDVEVPAIAVDAGVLRRCCTPSGLATLGALPADERAVEFAWLWTVKEACVKAAGTGLAGRPWDIPVEPGERAGRWREYAWRALPGDYAVPVSWAYKISEQEEA